MQRLKISAQHNERPLRQLGGALHHEAGHLILHLRGLIKENEIEAPELRRRRVAHTLDVRLSPDAVARVHGVHHDLVGLRQSVTVGVHQSACGAQDENVTSIIGRAHSSVHQEL